MQQPWTLFPFQFVPRVCYKPCKVLPLRDNKPSCCPPLGQVFIVVMHTSRCTGQCKICVHQLSVNLKCNATKCQREIWQQKAAKHATCWTGDLKTICQQQVSEYLGMMILATMATKSMGDWPGSVKLFKLSWERFCQVPPGNKNKKNGLWPDGCTSSYPKAATKLL